MDLPLLIQFGWTGMHGLSSTLFQLSSCVYVEFGWCQSSMYVIVIVIVMLLCRYDCSSRALLKCRWDSNSTFVKTNYCDVFYD